MRLADMVRTLSCASEGEALDLPQRRAICRAAVLTRPENSTMYQPSLWHRAAVAWLQCHTDVDVYSPLVAAFTSTAIAWLEIVRDRGDRDELEADARRTPARGDSKAKGI